MGKNTSGVAERYITIGGEQCHVKAYQASKTVWRAVGTYRGEHFEVKGRTASAAFNRWESSVNLRYD